MTKHTKRGTASAGTEEGLGSTEALACLGKDAGRDACHVYSIAATANGPHFVLLQGRRLLREVAWKLVGSGREAVGRRPVAAV